MFILSSSDRRFLTLDLNTAHKLLRLSERNRAATGTDTDQLYPDHPDRFDVCQVLCRESVCGRCYWEIEWSGDEGVCISVSYKSISRKGDGDECWFGCNDQSWSLICSRSSYSFYHNNIDTDLSVKPISSRIGVFDDDDDDDIYRIGVLFDDDDDDDGGEFDDDDDDDIYRIGVLFDDDDDDDDGDGDDDDDIRRIGVFVDHRAGTLSFYSVSDTMILIHTEQTTFTQTLYPGFRVYNGSLVKLCDLTAEIETC